jgi:hypothetical protein
MNATVRHYCGAGHHAAPAQEFQQQTKRRGVSEYHAAMPASMPEESRNRSFVEVPYAEGALKEPSAQVSCDPNLLLRRARCMAPASQKPGKFIDVGSQRTILHPPDGPRACEELMQHAVSFLASGRKETTDWNYAERSTLKCGAAPVPDPTDAPDSA